LPALLQLAAPPNLVGGNPPMTSPPAPAASWQEDSLTSLPVDHR
jgi:hypothetical protein